MRSMFALTAACHFSLLALALGGCSGAPSSPAAVPGGEVRPESAASEREIPVIGEAFVSAMTPEDNIDSPAAWASPDGNFWVIATAKATDALVVYDGRTGETVRRVGSSGSGQGEFLRPNGVAVVDDLLFVVERDNHRVQVLRLPGFGHVSTFAAADLVKPYGLWVNKVGDGYEVYVTDAYMAGEDAEGEDLLPPFSELDRRVKRFAMTPWADRFQTRLVSAFGDTGEQGALRVVESIWGDPEHDRLLIAEEDETYANELKVYNLAGNFAGRTIGRDVFKAQSEGVMLKSCADGGGWWITTEQGKGRTVFHLFDRVTLAYAGAVTGESVANTDGIWLHEAASDRFPHGVLYAVHDDQGVVAFDWNDVATALALPSCEVR